jgi:hypothetical protein
VALHLVRSSVELQDTQIGNAKQHNAALTLLDGAPATMAKQASAGCITQTDCSHFTVQCSHVNELNRHERARTVVRGTR